MIIIHKKTSQRTLEQTHFFIDETDFQLYPSRRSYWVLPHEQKFFNPPRHSPAIKVICGISIHGQVFLRTYTGTINSSKFKSIFRKVKPLVKKNIHHPIVVLDNATPHKSQETIQWFQNHFKILPLPPQSSEFNPLENVFAEMKKKSSQSTSKKSSRIRFPHKKNLENFEERLYQKNNRKPK